jgi:hypothetical protein
VEHCEGCIFAGVDEVPNLFPYRMLAGGESLLVLLDDAHTCQVCINRIVCFLNLLLMQCRTIITKQTTDERSDDEDGGDDAEVENSKED